MTRITTLFSLIILATFMQGCALFSAAGLSAQGQPIKQVNQPLVSIDSKPRVDHSSWNTLLKKHVSWDGIVNYKGFITDRDTLQSYLDILKKNEPQQDWPVQELLAYYINLYNAHTVQLIVENYPVQSIKDINGAWTKGIVTIGSRNLSLGGIENGILRKMNEPRIHFAINCASISCPKLLNEAYTPNKINEQLTLVTQYFIGSEKNELSSNPPRISAIFKWYAKDFMVAGKQNVVGYINQYAYPSIEPGVEPDFLEYNWDLNQQH